MSRSIMWAYFTTSDFVSKVLVLLGKSRRRIIAWQIHSSRLRIDTVFNSAMKEGSMEYRLDAKCNRNAIATQQKYIAVFIQNQASIENRQSFIMSLTSIVEPALEWKPAMPAGPGIVALSRRLRISNDQADWILSVARKKSMNARTFADRWRFCGYKIENGRERPA